MSRFHFVTEWTFEAPIEQVWALLNEPERFPEWWPGFEQAAKVSGDGEIGSMTRYRVRGDFGLAFDFTMQVKEKREPEHLRLMADGDFTGFGEWRLQSENGQTAVSYTWEVEVNRFWPRLLGRLPGSYRYLKRSHDRVMDAGGANLARLLSE